MHTRTSITLVVATLAFGSGMTMSYASYEGGPGQTMPAPTVSMFPSAQPPMPVVMEVTMAASGFPGTFQWLPEHFSGPCITAHGGVRKGAKLDQYRCLGAENQKWYVSPGSGLEEVTIHPFQNMDLCIDVPGADYRKGTQLILWSCNGGDNQTFLIVCDSGQRHCELRPHISSQRGKCMSVEGGKQANNTPLILWSCNGARDQKFTFR